MPNAYGEYSDESEDDTVEKMPEYQPPVVNKRQRSSVSAEVYGQFNKKKEFTPIVNPKSDETRQHIEQRLQQAFMFSALDVAERKTVIDAMVECTFEAD